MSGAIGPGDYVECIDPDYRWGGAVRLGGIYVVEIIHNPAETGACAECGARGGFELWGIAPDPDYSWCFHQFRPVYRPNSDLINALKQPAPSAVRKLVDV